MNIGFIGAGKVGFSMGKYLTERGMHVCGYYSRSLQASQEAAEFTGTRQYESLECLVRDSDAIFLTVSDNAIAQVWQQIREFPIQGKKIIHCSGLLSSAVFSDISRTRAHGFSIHPLLAVNDKYTSYQKLATAFFAVEGEAPYVTEFVDMLRGFNNTVGVLSAQDKVRYHAAAAMASNLYVGLVDVCEQLLCDCGFSGEEAHKALAPLVEGNARNIAQVGCVDALTGPVERNDVETVLAHLDCLSEQQQALYRMLSTQVVSVAKRKHPDRDYTMLTDAVSLQA